MLNSRCLKVRVCEVLVCEVIVVREEMEPRRDRDVFDAEVAIANLKWVIVVQPFVTGCHCSRLKYRLYCAIPSARHGLVGVRGVARANVGVELGKSFRVTVSGIGNTRNRY